MSKNIKVFFVMLVVNFLVLGILDVVFEYFDTGDDPLYSPRVAVKDLIMSLFIAVAIVLLNSRKNSGADQDGS